MSRPRRWYAPWRPSRTTDNTAADDRDAHGDEDAPRDEVTATLSADQPIVSAEQDRLERDHFARALVEDIRRAPRQNGFVIALTGVWGEGKTSVINLIEAELTERGEAVVIHFNPWLFSGTEELVEHFFDELIGQLRETKIEKLSHVASALETYGRVVTPLKNLPWIGEILRSTGAIATEASQALKGQSGSARLRARELRQRLAELDIPILIVVDDIDRLRPAEVIDVMRLVRLVGDFPNLVYMLAFDRPRVEEALGDGDPERGRAYLEKIVQVIHALPPVREQALSDLLAADLGEAIGDLSRYHFDREHFQNVFYGGVRDFIATVRDVRRLINVLPATFALIGDEVELTDVIALEALRVLAPDSFAAIAQHPDAFTTPSDVGRRGTTTNDAHKEQVQAALDAAGTKRATVERIVRELFPGASRHLGGSNYGSEWLDTWRRQRRVANPEVFDIYLRRRVAPGDVPARTVEQVFDAFEDPERLDALLSALDPDQLEQTLIRLNAYERDFPGTHPELTIAALMRHGEQLARRHRHMGDLGGPHMNLSRLVYRLLRNLNPDQVAATVEATRFPNFSSRFEVVRQVGHREGSGHRLVDPEKAKSYEAQLADDLLAVSAADMAEELDLGVLLGMIQALRPDDTPAAIAKWSDDDRFFFRLVGTHLRTSLSNTLGQVAVRRHTQLDWPALVAQVGLEKVIERISEIDPAQIDADFDDDTRDAWNQAVRYAADPAAGERDAARWSNPGAGDD
jgi:predicted KAP-like P-loop ATPase